MIYGPKMAGEDFVVGEAAAAAATTTTQSPKHKHSHLGGSRFRPQEQIFICSFPFCDATFNRGWKLDAHLCRHTGQRPFVCIFEGCGKGFTRGFHLKRHFLTHTGEKQFVCTVDGCNKKFITKSNLNKHVLRRHHQRKYVCDFENCGQSFKKHQQLKIHQSQHTGEPFFKCGHEECGKRFSSPSHLKRHEKIHQGYACKKESCLFVGKTWSEYLKHMRLSHVEPVTCQVCSKTLTRKDYLKCHMKTHAVDREVFKCPKEGCKRTYTTVFNLQSHIHSFHEQSLIRHMVLHDPNKKRLDKKKPQQKRSLASHLSGYIPPKVERRNLSSVEESVPASVASCKQQAADG
ncbi:transcription factor IIIA isoform X2 [Crotalus tigris]|uniref:transcription factor IIIA isoform X2 n=1 Tax=Crotalus tigris TaxID=88082 RepID=UPI00192F22A2|nr:transcription factor IIIA isoform X2 [Crotalus tigris]